MPQAEFEVVAPLFLQCHLAWLSLILRSMITRS